MEDSRSRSDAVCRLAEATVEPLESRTHFSVNLLFNGNFSRGPIGFHTGLNRGLKSLLNTDAYIVGTNPLLYHYAAASFGDHTTGSGKMLLINGSVIPGAITWREVVHVVPGVAYDFAGWAASWATAIDQPGLGDVSPADVQVTINGQAISSTLLPSVDGQWTSLSGTWLANSPHAIITVTDLNTSASGNDSAYDDFSFSPLASIHGEVISATPIANHPTIRRLAPVAGATVYLDLNHDGQLDATDPVAVTNRLGRYVFTGLVAGNYQVLQANPPASSVATAPLVVSLPDGKQAIRENLWDIYTAAVSVGAFK